MDFLVPVAPSLLLASVVAYLLGALPLGDQISRRQGVDIFSVGTGLAGASNVRRCVDDVSGLLVLIGDLSKGALAILVGQLIGIEGPWLVVLALSVVAGHWKSVFTRFRGGDGLAPLGGVVLVMFPVFGPISIAVATVIALGGQRLPYPSLLSIVFGYGTLASLVMANDGDHVRALAIGGLCGLVLARALLGHRWRNSSLVVEDLEEMSRSR